MSNHFNIYHTEQQSSGEFVIKMIVEGVVCFISQFISFKADNIRYLQTYTIGMPYLNFKCQSHFKVHVINCKRCVTFMITNDYNSLTLATVSTSI